MEFPKTPKMKNAEETDILTRAVSTVVFTNSVFFSFFCVSLKFAFYAENTIKWGLQPPKKQNKTTI